MSGQKLPHDAPPEQHQEQVQSANEVESDKSSLLGDEDVCVEINLPDISENLQCPICLGVIRNTKAVMECLHRFCGECIEKSIRLCKNECPVCCEHIPGGCTLGDDLIYDHLISIIHPDIDKYEEESLRRLTEEFERKQKARAIAVTFARSRRIIRNACEHQISNDNEVMNDNDTGKELLSDAEKTKAEPNEGGETKVLQESATLHADGTGDENINS